MSHKRTPGWKGNPKFSSRPKVKPSIEPPATPSVEYTPKPTRDIVYRWPPFMLIPLLLIVLFILYFLIF